LTAAQFRRTGLGLAQVGEVDNYDASTSLPRPIRVMHVLFALRMGGAELGVVKLANGLTHSRVTTAICSCKPSDSLKTRLAPEVSLIEFDRRDGQDPRLVLQLARLFRRERPDIVHTHSWGTLLEGFVAARLAGVPHVVHGEHGTMEMRGRSVWLQRWAWKRADRVLSVSSRLAESMSAHVRYPLDRIRVIRNGIDTDRFSPEHRLSARAALGFDTDDVVVGTAGRLVPVKDHATLLRALGSLRSRGRRFKALIAGEGPLREPLLAAAEDEKLTGSVQFLGARDDIERVLAACDVFVLSSVSEGLSNTILEAMASGVAVVATHVGGADELVEDGRTGLLVPPSNPNRLAEAIESLLSDAPRRRAMGLAGRQRARQEFSLERMVAAYEALYSGLVDGPRPSRSGTKRTEPICVA
jgi:sugar transferase (PEP-CTERM/EpsH1 system associated)